MNGDAGSPEPGGRFRVRAAVGVLGAVLVLLLSGCVRPSPGAGAGAGAGGIPAPAPGPVTQQVWRSDGYGRVYVLVGDRLRTYQITEISCMPGESAVRTSGPDANGVLSFGDEGVARETLRIGPDGHAVFHELGVASDIDLLPLPSLPTSCQREPDDDPLTTFDVFWTTVAENYNSLRRKNVDWVAVRDRYRPMIDEDTGSTELFGILRAMIEPFGDMHTGITAARGREFEGSRPGTVDIPAKKTDTAIDNYLLAHAATGFLSFAGGKIVYADLPGGRGYLRIDSFEQYGEDDSYLANSAELARALDTVLTKERVAGWRMLVIDLRNNPGGEDALGLEVAARLTDRPYLAYTKAARNDPKDPDKHARAQTSTVTPAAAPRYTGPVRLLTGELTISAGETFTLAMMGRTPAPERIGANTQGVYADTLSRKLPNGWTLTLGNEDFVGPDGRSYEGPGIPPTTPTPVFPPAELAANQDSALETALR